MRPGDPGTRLQIDFGFGQTPLVPIGYDDVAPSDSSLRAVAEPMPVPGPR